MYSSEGISPVHHHRYPNLFLKGDPLDVHRIKSPTMFISTHLLLTKTLDVWNNFS